MLLFYLASTPLTKGMSI